MRRHDATPGARLGNNGLPDADEHLCHVARRDRQSRCRRVRCLQGRHEGHGCCGAGVHLRGTHVRNELHARRRCIRRGRESLLGGDDGPHRDDRLRGHDRPDDADEPRRDVRHHDGAHALVVRGDRQRRSQRSTRSRATGHWSRRRRRRRRIRPVSRAGRRTRSPSSPSTRPATGRRPRSSARRRRRARRRVPHRRFSRSTVARATTASSRTRPRWTLSYFPIAVWGAYNQTQANRDLDAAAGSTRMSGSADSNSHGRHPR